MPRHRISSAFIVLALATGLAAGTATAQPAAEGPFRFEQRGAVDVGFSPGPGAERLVLEVIDKAKVSVVVAAYSFTNPKIARALVAAKRRGVDVRVVLDSSQLSERYSSATFLANAGVPVRINSQFRILHNKMAVVDGRHTQTGSMNYTAAGVKDNAENVIVLWDNPELARYYTDMWTRYWDAGQAYASRN